MGGGGTVTVGRSRMIISMPVHRTTSANHRDSLYGATGTQVSRDKQFENDPRGYAFSIVAVREKLARRSRYNSASSRGDVITSARHWVCASHMIAAARSAL